MAKLSRRAKSTYRRSNYAQEPGKPIINTFQPVRNQAATQLYDVNKYIKKDILWGAFCGGVCIILMIVAYFVLR